MNCIYYKKPQLSTFVRPCLLDRMIVECSVVVPSNFTMSFPDDLVDVGDGKDDKENAVNQEKERIGSLLMKQISFRGQKTNL